MGADGGNSPAGKQGQLSPHSVRNCALSSEGSAGGRGASQFLTGNGRSWRESQGKDRERRVGLSDSGRGRRLRMRPLRRGGGMAALLIAASVGAQIQAGAGTVVAMVRCFANTAGVRGWSCPGERCGSKRARDCEDQQRNGDEPAHRLRIDQRGRRCKFGGQRVVVQFGLRIGPVKREIPSASLRAGSSLRLKSGYAQDDNVSLGMTDGTQDHRVETIATSGG